MRLELINDGFILEREKRKLFSKEIIREKIKWNQIESFGRTLDRDFCVSFELFLKNGEEIFVERDDCLDFDELFKKIKEKVKELGIKIETMQI